MHQMIFVLTNWLLDLEVNWFNFAGPTRNKNLVSTITKRLLCFASLHSTTYMIQYSLSPLKLENSNNKNTPDLHDPSLNVHWPSSLIYNPLVVTNLLFVLRVSPYSGMGRTSEGGLTRCSWLANQNSHPGWKEFPPGRPVLHKTAAESAEVEVRTKWGPNIVGTSAGNREDRKLIGCHCLCGCEHVHGWIQSVWAEAAHYAYHLGTERLQVQSPVQRGERTLRSFCPDRGLVGSGTVCTIWPMELWFRQSQCDGRKQKRTLIVPSHTHSYALKDRHEHKVVHYIYVCMCVKETKV